MMAAPEGEGLRQQKKLIVSVAVVMEMGTNMYIVAVTFKNN
jgi:hypothetical protein